ncbi:DUF6049 family protein [Microbacterium sp. gxy059]|uniref:DUF6049 family protein n=1 Tax=Microbacterium sp. gxy059 TaxID=2957199 RepID=UPI003D97078B
MTTSLLIRRRAALCGAALALALTAAPIAAHADVPAPRQLPATVANAEPEPGDDAEGRPPLRIAPTSRGVVTGGSASVRVEIANSSGEEIPESSVAISRGDRLGSARDIDAWLDGSASTSLTELDSLDTETVGGGDVLGTSTSVDLGDIPSGVYPLHARFDGANPATEARSLLIVTGGDRPAVAMVMPITGPVDTRGLFSADVLATLTGEDGLLSAQLDAVEGTAAVLAVDPAIPAAIRVLGEAAPASATEWLTRLETLPNDRFALQFADADVTAQLDAGLATPLGPAGLDAYLPGDVTEAPELDDLLDIGGQASSSIVWPAPGSADDDTLAAIGDARVLVPASSTVDGSPALGQSVLAYDDAAGDALLEAAQATSSFDRETALVAATAELWLGASETDGPLLVALDRMGSDELDTDAEGVTSPSTAPDVTADGLREAVQAGLRSPAFAPTGLSDALAAGSGSVALREAPDDEERVAAVRRYQELAPAIWHISTALERPELLRGQTRAEMLRFLSVGWTTNHDAWADRRVAFEAELARRGEAIDLQDPSPVHLLSPEADMPVWIRNDLPYPARVVIEAVPDDPRLSIEQRTEVIAQPESSTRVTIPIEARVGSGDLVVHYALHAMTGEQIGPPRDMQVAVRAEWERIGVTVLVVLVVLLLGAGTYRQIHRRRRDRAEAAEEEAAERADADPDGDGSDDAAGEDPSHSEDGMN